MFQNLDTWLVLLSLAITIVALGAWIKNAGDDWLRHEEAADAGAAMPAEARATPGPRHHDMRAAGMAGQQQAGA